MMISKKWMWCLAGALAFCGAGCETMHSFHPSQWHKLNRVPNSMPRTDYNFSIPDPPIPSAEVAAGEELTSATP